MDGFLPQIKLSEKHLQKVSHDAGELHMTTVDYIKLKLGLAPASGPAEDKKDGESKKSPGVARRRRSEKDDPNSK